MNKECIVSPDVSSDLACGLHKRLRLNIANRATDLGDNHIRNWLLICLKAHSALDLVGDVRDDLNSVTQILTATLFGNDIRIGLTGSHVCCRV